MAVIKAKKRPVIQKGAGYVYDKFTFITKHKVSNFYTVQSAEELLQCVKPFELFDRKFITFDTETHPHFGSSQEVPKEVVRRWVGKGKKAIPQDYPFCISVCDGKAAYTLYDSVDNNFEEFKKLMPLFCDPSIEKIAHNVKFDMHMFANAGLRIVGKLHDTIVIGKLVNENRMSFQLKDIVAKKPGGIVKYEEMVNHYKQLAKVSDYRNIPRELLSEYANADVWNCFVVFNDEFSKLFDYELDNLYETELAVTIATYEMERYGMKVDVEYEGPLKGELQQLSDSAERDVYKEAGKMFNINSGKQLYSVLMNMGVSKEWISFTDKGNPTLDKAALERLADIHEVSIVKKILEFRKYEKLLGTYANGIYGQRDAEDAVHGSINQTEATTGRMSITKPALQTLPKKDKRIRSAFIPDDDFILYFMDLDQVEYRLFAHYAKAEGLLEAIRNGYDVHTATAAIIYNKPIDQVTEEEREKAKRINFAKIYGQGIDATAALLKMTLTESALFNATYFAAIPEAKPFINTVHHVIKLRGYIKNFYGRRRRLTTNEGYKAPNALIQGCAADYIKNKLVGILKYLRYNNLKTYLANIVHDELVIAFHKDELAHVPVLRRLLSEFKAFRCPITAGVDKGAPSWGHKVAQSDVGFEEPADLNYLNYNVFDGSVFDINKEEDMQ